MSAHSLSSPKMTLWIWPTGLYSRRIIYYLKAKALPRSVLETLTLVPVSLDLSTGTLGPPAGFEPRPTGTSLPALKVDDRMIYQSSSILTYFEEIYGQFLSGTGSIHRARVADIVQLVNEAGIWLNVYIRHATAISLYWSGMTKEEQSHTAAEDGLKQLRAAMARLDSWVKDDVVGQKSKSIAGGDEPTLADFTLMAQREYIAEMYDGLEMFEGCSVLNEWYARAKHCEWYVDGKGCTEIEKEGFEKLFVD